MKGKTVFNGLSLLTLSMLSMLLLVLGLISLPGINKSVPWPSATHFWVLSQGIAYLYITIVCAIIAFSEKQR